MILMMVNISKNFLNMQNPNSCIMSAWTYLIDEAGGDLFVLHRAAWQSLWNDGRIEVDGNLELSKIIYGSLYYILSSAPVTATTNIPARQFYGLSVKLMSI